MVCERAELRQIFGGLNGLSCSLSTSCHAVKRLLELHVVELIVD